MERFAPLVHRWRYGQGCKGTSAWAVWASIGMTVGSDVPNLVTPTETIAELYRREHLAMVRVAHLIVGSAALAEEVVHDAFVTVLERQDTIVEPGAYLRRVVVNNCHGLTRRTITGRLKMAHLTSLEQAGAVSLPPDVDETWQALDLVTPKQRTALVLRFYVDLPIADIADVMGERQGTVKSLIHRGLSTLRKELPS